MSLLALYTWLNTYPDDVDPKNMDRRSEVARRSNETEIVFTVPGRLVSAQKYTPFGSDTLPPARKAPAR